MIPFNEDQQRNFIERTCGLAKDRGWEGMFSVNFHTLFVRPSTMVSKMRNNEVCSDRVFDRRAADLTLKNG